MTIFGYIRKDFPEGTMKQLTRLIPYNCDEIFIEEVQFDEESELKRMMKKVQKDDTIIIYHSAVFMKNIRGYAIIMKELEETGIHFISIEEKIKTSSKSHYYETIQQLADMERIVVQNKTVKGIEKARADGRIGGRPKITEAIIHEINELRFSQKLSLRDIAQKCDVSLGTVHKYVSEESNEAQENHKTNQEREAKHYEEKKIFA